MTDEQEKQPSGTVAEVIKELKSEFSHAGGPKKEIACVTMFMNTTDAPNNESDALIDISAYEESPWGDTGNTKKSFHLSLADTRCLAEVAPKFRESFANIAREMGEQLETARAPIVRAQKAKEHADNMQAVGTWCDDGLPTQQPTSVMKPLRLKISPGT